MVGSGCQVCSAHLYSWPSAFSPEHQIHSRWKLYCLGKSLKSVMFDVPFNAVVSELCFINSFLSCLYTYGKWHWEKKKVFSHWMLESFLSHSSFGAPGWLRWLGICPWVMMPGSWDWILHQVPCSVGAAASSASASLPACALFISCLVCTLSRSEIKSWKEKTLFTK